jgi:hypothetical protein
MTSATQLSQREKLLHRLADLVQVLPPATLVTVHIVVGRDGEPVAWALGDQMRAEGLLKEVPVS